MDKTVDNCWSVTTIGFDIAKSVFQVHAKGMNGAAIGATRQDEGDTACQRSPVDSGIPMMALDHETGSDTGWTAADFVRREASQSSPIPTLAARHPSALELVSRLPELDGVFVVAIGEDGFALHVELWVDHPSEDEACILVFAEDRVSETDSDPREGGFQGPALEIGSPVVLNIGIGGH